MYNQIVNVYLLILILCKGPKMIYKMRRYYRYMYKLKAIEYVILILTLTATFLSFEIRNLTNKDFRAIFNIFAFSQKEEDICF